MKKTLVILWVFVPKIMGWVVNKPHYYISIAYIYVTSKLFKIQARQRLIIRQWISSVINIIDCKVFWNSKQYYFATLLSRKLRQLLSIFSGLKSRSQWSSSCWEVLSFWFFVCLLFYLYPFDWKTRLSAFVAISDLWSFFTLEGCHIACFIFL